MTNEKEWWKESFEDAFPKPEGYVQKDRTLSQLQNAFNGDQISEAIDDYREEQSQIQSESWRSWHTHLEAYVENIVAEAERRGEMKAWEEVSLVLKDVKQEFRCAACDGASNLSHTHTCSAFAKIEAKLTSLKTP